MLVEFRASPAALGAIEILGPLRLMAAQLEREFYPIGKLLGG